MASNIEDPAVVAGKEAHEAGAAFDALPRDTDEDTPLFKAAQKRLEAADEAFADAPITSAAGALVKMRLIMDFDEDPDRESPKFLAPRHFDTVVAFLEGAPAPAPKPDPAVTLFAKWGKARDEFKRVAAEQAALGQTEDDNPEWNRCYNAMEAIELDMMITRSTTVSGIYAKLHLFEYWYGINNDPIPFETVEDLEELNWDLRHVRSALRDAEQLAGAPSGG